MFPAEVQEVDEVALSMANEIRNQYIITYTPTNQSLDGSFRQIKVVANGPGRPMVRTRSGYYATPDSSKKSRCSEPVTPFSLESLPWVPSDALAEPLSSLAHRDVFRTSRRSY